MITSKQLAMEIRTAARNLNDLDNTSIDLKDLCVLVIAQCELLKARMIDFMKQEEDAS